ncbi:DUF871 domain-containing protein [Lactobacillus sp. DCY120]|uniref:DUF871 domain-containing protein n=1 Tax=Bombilactobacillus apium TaxID=2675299 RepID=A0A850R6N5_9LACO|nr:MupG family TIM beta-alpha barrel fold protein [Bombilactobacillus apium]NVY96487.1 DUF871 domain-containing protein [Bombilactobacillus apium]
MRMLGVSIYPDLSDFKQDQAYLDLASQYGYQRVFTSLLQLVGENGEDILGKFRRTVDYANSLGLKVIVDINPSLFESLGISYDDLSFFHELKVWGLRLDEGFSGLEEAQMTRNPYGLKIELNMSRGTHYLDQIMDYGPNPDNLLGCHNFYPQSYTGLGEQIFLDYSKSYRKHQIHSAAFVSSQVAKIGPWPVSEGLPTIETDRKRLVASQVQHLLLTGMVDDVIIGNAYASEAELKAIAAAFQNPYPFLQVDLQKNISALEEKITLEETHLYRGDASDYLLRDTNPRVKYSQEIIPAHDNTVDFQRGDVVIVNEGYKRYKGELQIVLQPFPNDGRRNLVGRLTASDLPLLQYIKPWSSFQLRAAD